ncbi:hypothetical protein VNO78_20208 [Psophocarpus tetragonolobus]|uniref:Uncharacterized protein n=1 Tax=Psophocarpus tetragonolobus TaxID=3891 RepID=A0AAN9S9E8_PSOTE
MLDSVVEYISQAASSYAFIFCFCNLIIVIILVDLKPKLGFDQESEEIPLSVPTNTGIQGANSKCLVNKNTLSPQAYAKEEVVVDKVETEGDHNYNCNREEDDELKRRVEEFIERVNEGWKAESVSTSSLIRGENNNNNRELLE